MDILDKLFSRELNRRTGERAIKIDADKKTQARNRFRRIGADSLRSMSDKPSKAKEKSPKQSERYLPQRSDRGQDSFIRRINIRFPWLKIIFVCVVGFVAIIDLLDLTISKVSSPCGKIKVAPMSRHVQATKRDLFGKKLVALTFDDGPSSQTTPILLDILKEKEAPSTFFMLGSMARNNPDIVKRIDKEEHEAASHTMYHQNLVRISTDAVNADVNEANSNYSNILGRQPGLTRPPYGNFNDSVSRIINTPIILWSVDSLDWKDKNADSVVANTMSQVHDGAVILMHDLYPTTVESIPKLIDTLRAEGYEFVTVSKLAKMRGVNLVNGSAYYNFRP